MTDRIVDRLTISEIREYRATRVAKIKNGETPKPLDNSNELPKIIFHLVPVRAFAPSMIFNLSWLHKNLGKSGTSYLPPVKLNNFFLKNS